MQIIVKHWVEAKPNDVCVRVFENNMHLNDHFYVSDETMDRFRFGQRCEQFLGVCNACYIIRYMNVVTQ